MNHELDGSYCYWDHGGEPLPPQVAYGNGSQDGSDSEASSSSAVQPVSAGGQETGNGPLCSSPDIDDSRQQRPHAASAV